MYIATPNKEMYEAEIMRQDIENEERKITRQNLMKLGLSEAQADARIRENDAQNRMKNLMRFTGRTETSSLGIQNIMPSHPKE